MRRPKRWRLMLKEDVDNDLQYIENSFKQLNGRYPSKSELVGLLVENMRGKKLRKKRGKIFCI